MEIQIKSKSKFYYLMLLVFCVSTVTGQVTQDNLFDLADVQLLDGPFKSSMELNVEVLLKYDVDRLLEPYLKEAGLTPKGAPYTNWDGLAGHVGGHYLSALAIHYASTGDSRLKDRLDYMIAELETCQNDNGYVGGVPNSDAVWQGLSNGNFTSYYNAWVPWYNLHKTYAGLRDAWYYTNNEKAKEMFLKLCDWGITTLQQLSDAQIQEMLDVEFGGMNEVYADAYRMSGDSKYLNTAMKFTHNRVFNTLSKGVDNLDNMHANTQIPKFVGFASVALADQAQTTYYQAADNFWNTVVENRTLALGGNSRREHFPSVNAYREFLEEREGPESCNTYNMLKLSSQVQQVKPEGKYVDYYEGALFNHILSTQHPEHGGYVYFTPVMTMHYRVYSAPNEAMWCCVGTGLENHGKHAQFIYSKTENELFVNLFIASELNWEEKGVKVIQTTNFPEENTTKLTFSGSADFKLNLRYPSWVAEDSLQIFINGAEIPVYVGPGEYLPINMDWQDGDVVEMKFPMQFSVEEMPNVPEYVAIKYGPILLGAKTSTEGLTGLVADDGRWSHIASGNLMGVYESPIIISKREEIAGKIQPIEDQPLSFDASALFPDQSKYEELVLEPFYKIHDSRYMMYFLELDPDDSEEIIAELKQHELERLITDARTIDYVGTGEQQPEKDHNMQTENSSSGLHANEYWRDASSGGYFAYVLATEEMTDLSLMVRYWGNETGSRRFDILIDEEVLIRENLVGKWNVDEFVNVEYPIDTNMLIGKDQITVKFQPVAGNTAGGVFYVRLLKNQLSSVATLSDISLDGSQLMDFSADQYEYDVTLDAPHLPVPEVEALPYDENARVEIRQAKNLQGESTITVTAEDQVTTLTYTINFYSKPLQSSPQQEVVVFPNPASAEISVKAPLIQVMTLSCIDMSGRKVLSKEIKAGDQALDISHLQSGTYLILLEGKNYSTSTKFIKK